jgi:hypothetical protein
MPNSYGPKASTLSAGCVWKNVELELFGRKTQRLKFRYAFCADTPRPAQFKIGNHNRSAVTVNDGRLGQSVLAIEKLGPTEPKDFLNQNRDNAKRREHCELIQQPKGYWVTRDKKVTCAQAVTHTIGGQTRYWFVNGIAFSHIVELDKIGIDPASVHYENRG